MRLSDGEKLILVMLSNLYKRLDIKDTEIDPEFVTTTISYDYPWGFRWKYDWIFNSQDTDPPEVQETVDILNMYRSITSAYKRLEMNEQERVKQQTAPYDNYVTFQGFDGNNDPHISIVNYLVKHLGRFEELKETPHLNSHSSTTLPKYRRMLGVFKPIIGSGGHDLTAGEIIQILKT